MIGQRFPRSAVPAPRTNRRRREGDDQQPHDFGAVEEDGSAKRPCTHLLVRCTVPARLGGLHSWSVKVHPFPAAFSLFDAIMHILYVDDSGSVENPQDRFFVLGGVSVFERGLHHLIEAADNLVATFGFVDVAEVELHGSPMYSGRGTPWKSVKLRNVREQMIVRALALLSANASVRLFAVAVDRASVAPLDPVELAFEEICNRFNLFLQRQNNSDPRNGQRGLIVMDESKHEQPLQAQARRYRTEGGRWGTFRNLSEVPLFVDSRASRIVQLADLVAYATWRKYEHQDGRFFDSLIPLFDARGGIIHGLFHYRRTTEECYCVACFSRSLNRPIGRENR